LWNSRDTVEYANAACAVYDPCTEAHWPVPGSATRFPAGWRGCDARPRVALKCHVGGPALNLARRAGNGQRQSCTQLSKRHMLHDLMPSPRARVITSPIIATHRFDIGLPLRRRLQAGLAYHHFHRQPQPRQRRAQVVQHPRHRDRAGSQQLLDLLRQFVEAAAQGRDFARRPVSGQAFRRLPPPLLGHGRLQTLQWSGGAACQPPGRSKRQQHTARQRDPQRMNPTRSDPFVRQARRQTSAAGRQGHPEPFLVADEFERPGSRLAHSLVQRRHQKFQEGLVPGRCLRALRQLCPRRL
jgi:hypothetical protein